MLQFKKELSKSTGMFCISKTNVLIICRHYVDFLILGRKINTIY